jgi:hypothetical protein
MGPETVTRRGSTADSLLHGKADIILGQRLRCGSGTGDVIEFRELTPLIKGIAFVPMQHGSHPPGKALDTPDTPKTHHGILIQQIGASQGVKMF